MENDTQLVHHLWWLNKFLTRQFEGKEYKDIIRNELDTDTVNEIDALVSHIKLNY